jgi:shikimate dehydrogenase
MMSDNRNIDLYAVVGNPIAHSKSPQIYNNFIEINNLDAHYTRLQAKSFDEIIELIKIYDIKGINVTSPFKSEAYKACDQCDEIAKELSAVNTIKIEKHKLLGYNTDPLGVSGAFEDSNIKLNGKSALIIGTGPAAYAAAFALRPNIDKMYFYSHSESRAKLSAEKFGGDSLANLTLNAAIQQVEFIVNCSTILDIDGVEVTKEQVVLDANYADSKLARLAESAGATIIQGESWLINQALPAIEILLGVSTKNIENKFELLCNVENQAMPCEEDENEFGKSLDTCVDQYESQVQVDDREVKLEDLSGNESEFREKTQPRCGEYGNNSGKPIALIGFMGAGKSVLGKRLAAKVDREFIDLDIEIEKQVGMTINEFFAQCGEEEFREIESEILLLALNKKNVVISCGGGIVVREENRELLSKKAFTINLHVDSDIALKRIDTRNRPLLQSENPVEKAKEIFEGRMKNYLIFSELTINTNHLSLDEVEKELINAIEMMN